MNPIRSLRGAALLLAATMFANGVAGAAPSNTLSFRVLARFSAKDTRDGSLAATQNFDARVFAKGNRARVETVLSDRPLVLLLSPPYVYRLLPNARAGVRYKTTGQVAQTLSATNLAALLRDPSALRRTLVKGGAKRAGVQTLNGQKLELWTASQFAGRAANVKAWLRAGDALPARLQISSRGVDLSASWRDYRKNAQLSDALFSVPQGFRVREAQDNVAPL